MNISINQSTPIPPLFLAVKDVAPPLYKDIMGLAKSNDNTESESKTSELIKVSVVKRENKANEMRVNREVFTGFRNSKITNEVNLSGFDDHELLEKSIKGFATYQGMQEDALPFEGTVVDKIV